MAQGWGPQRYLSGAGARAAVALALAGQPAPPPAGSAAVPGLALRRSGPASAAPPHPESPPPAMPWPPHHPLVPPAPPVSPRSTLLPRRVPSLASETFISSISASVGALSRTRGRGRAGAVLPGQWESSRQELEARRLAQACGMQGRELYPAEGHGLSPGFTGTCCSAGHATSSLAWRGGDGGTFLAVVWHFHWPKFPLLPDLLQDLLVERPLLLGQGPQPPL